MIKTKIKNYLTWQRILALIGLQLLIAASVYSPISAQSVTTGYYADQALQRGMIVRLKKNDVTKVEPVDSDASEHMHGVVVNSNDSPISLASDGQKVFVANNGRSEVLVSTQAGKIVIGDYIVVSALAGIGMKAGTIQPFVIGRAVAEFDGSKGVISTMDVKDSTGASHRVDIGRIEVDVGIAKNPLLKAVEPNLPGALRKVAETIAGKPVNAARVYVSVLVFGITAVVAGSLLFSGVRSGIISIGRNPLSRKSIIRGMLQVVLTGIIIFITGVFGVYLILRL